MSKLNSQKQWQKNRPEKVKEYTTRYLADKARVTVVFWESDIQRIDAIKDPDITRAEWIRLLVLAKLGATEA